MRLREGKKDIICVFLHVRWGRNDIICFLMHIRKEKKEFKRIFAKLADGRIDMH